MNNEKQTWFLVICKFQKYEAALFNDLAYCKQFADSKKLPYKTFHHKRDAIKSAGCPESKIKIRITEHLPQKICLVCEKPFHGKTKLCPSCNKKRNEISTGSIYPVSIGTLTTIKRMYPNKNAFSVINESPWILQKISRTTTAQGRAKTRKEKTAQVTSETYLNQQYSKSDITIPDYIKEIFAKDKSKEFLYLRGNRLNPYVFYTCKRCKKEQCQTYENLRSGQGHDCSAVMPSGEVIVEDYLKKNHISYKTQRNTLRCINPRTNSVLPYDFELPEHRIIIEVQGEQHLSFLPYFHGSVENFEYQCWKDQYKKAFAQQKGYQVIYIDYHDIHTDHYKKIINDAILLSQS